MMPDQTPPTDPVEDLANVAYLNSKKRAPDTSPPPEPDGAEKHFRPLGYNRDIFFFFSVRGDQVLGIRRSSLGRKETLYALAPMQWWEREFAGDNGFRGRAVDMAVNYLIESCYDRDVFRLDRLRGRGAWWDDGRAVIHAGSGLIVDGKPTALDQISSRYVYEAQPALAVDLAHPLSNAEAADYLNVCTSLAWERGIYGRLLAGWTVCALASGALHWRPHIMVTGPAGCGKSWVVEHLMQRMFGDWCVATKGETTEAGLRQTLGQDAVPIIWDEAEGDSKRSSDNLDRVLGLMRQASADVGGQLLKGGAEGSSSAYTVRSCFCLSAIRVPFTQTADQQRITVLSLRRNSDAEGFAEIERLVDGFDDGWAARFRARVFANLPVLRENSLVFARAAAGHFKSSRFGDQLGPMLAGAMLLHGDPQAIDIDRARRIVDKIDLHDQDELVDETDEAKLLCALMETEVRAHDDGRGVDITIGELLRIAFGAQHHETIKQKTAHNKLIRHGIKLLGGQKVAISNTHLGLKRLLDGTPWAVGWYSILRRIDGSAAAKQPVLFHGVKSRATVLDTKVVLNMFDD